MKRACLRVMRRYMDAARMLIADWQKDESAMRMKYSLLGAAIFCMAAHAFAYFNFAPIHDAVNYVDHFAGTWEVSLGRFMQPVYGLIRGKYTMPWFSGMFSMLFIGLSAFLINDLFDIKNRWMILLTAGFLSANATMNNMNMVFSYVADAFGMALLLVCIGAYAVIRMPNILGTLICGACFAVSMGIYQSYAFFGGALIVLYTMIQAMEDRRLLEHRRMDWLHYAAAAVITVAAYLAAYFYFMEKYRTSMPSWQSYNSPAKLGHMDIPGLISKAFDAYESFAVYFFGAGRDKLNLIQKGTIGLFGIGGVLFIAYSIRTKLPIINALLIAIGILSFPGIALATSILAHHISIHFLTAHTLFLMYPALLAAMSKIRIPMGRGEWSFQRSRLIKMAVYVLCGCILFANIRTSNQLYTYRAVQYDKTVSYVTRLLGFINAVPGYERKNTEVVFIGHATGRLYNLSEPDDLEWMTGMGQSGTTYLEVLQSFLHMMGERMNIVSDFSEISSYESMEEVKEMPSFPDPACCKMIDDKLIVKLSWY